MAIIQRPKRPQAQPLDLERPRTSPASGRTGSEAGKSGAHAALVAMRLGRAVGSSISATGGCLAIGRDTRRSGDMLTAALVAGATSVGVDVVDLGVVPTAALAFAAARWPYDAGIMVSASHNPAADNGLKVVDGFGLKVAEGRERELEAELNRCDEPAGPGNHGLGRLRDGRDEVARYQANRLALARRIHAPVRIVVDCAQWLGECLRRRNPVRHGGLRHRRPGISGWRQHQRRLWRHRAEPARGQGSRERGRSRLRVRWGCRPVRGGR